jgi:phosphatidylglycerol lysyltransferase
VVLTGDDLLAFAYIGRRLPRLKIALASFLAYAISNNVGFAMLSGASVRYRFYTRWGITADELTRIVFSYSVTFWLGLFALGGLSLVMSPVPDTRLLPAHGLLVAVGWLLMAVPPAYLVCTVVRPTPLRVRSFALPLPPIRIAAAQALISAVDWALAGAVLYVLLPASALTFVQFLGIFLVAILVGMVSHVPGGVGVFEGLMVLLLKPFLASGELLPALVVFRAGYYLLPLFLGLLGLVADEVWQRRAQVTRAGAAVGRVTQQLTPAALATATFVAGVVLLFSSATPAAPGRLALLARILPLAVVETSHFLGSIAGAALLILSQGLSRRLDAAYYFTGVTIAAGMAASLLKGIDYEEATLLLLILLALRRAQCRDLIRLFLERCHDHGGVPVFYEVGTSQLHHYVDFGLVSLKLGEEAKVDLTSFSLEGGRAAKYRQALRRLEKEGGTFRVLDPADVPRSWGSSRRCPMTGSRRRPAPKRVSRSGSSTRRTCRGVPWPSSSATGTSWRSPTSGPAPITRSSPSI